MSKHAGPSESSFPKRRELRHRMPRSSDRSPVSEPRTHHVPEPRPASSSTKVARPVERAEPAEQVVFAQSAEFAEATEAASPRDGALAAVSFETAGTPLRDLLPPVLSLSPFSNDAELQSVPCSLRSSSGIAEASPKKRRRAAAVGLTGSVALILTMALPGLEFGDENTANAAALPQQLLHTGEGAVDSTSFDALNVVEVEAGESSGTFVNYRDSRVQFPFADTVPLTDPFGERDWPVAGMHDAQDFAAAEGSPIQVIADGKVVEAGYASDGCGFGLKVEHQIDGLTVTSRYCHMQMNSHNHAVGDQLEVGDLAGKVGSTGIAFGAHLHFALTIDGVATDPMPFLLKYNRLLRKP